MTVPRRVHIVPQGFEDERIHIPATERDAENVVLIGHEEEDERATKCYENIVDELDSEDITHEREECDIFDMNDSIETILGVIRNQDPNNYISVNISSGSKITAIAGMLSCMFTDANPYYVVPEDYHGPDDDRPAVSYGKKTIRDLPAYPVTEPDYELIQVLDFIDREQPDEGPSGVIKHDIGEYLLEEDLPAVQGSEKDPDDAEDVYPMVNDEILDPLERKGLIDITPLQRGKHIRTTKDGKEMVSIGKSLLGSRSTD